MYIISFCISVALFIVWVLPLVSKSSIVYVCFHSTLSTRRFTFYFGSGSFSLAVSRLCIYSIGFLPSWCQFRGKTRQGQREQYHQFYVSFYKGLLMKLKKLDGLFIPVCGTVLIFCDVMNFAKLLVTLRYFYLPI